MEKTDNIDFTNISYLQHGNEKQQLVYKLLIANKIFEILKDYSPVLTGTIPIEIDTDSSDLDIACCYKNETQFVASLISFINCKDFSISEVAVRDVDTMISSFKIDGFKIEVFGQNRKVKDQESYKHMMIEHQILLKKGTEFREKIIALKKSGLNTEAAFCQLLGIQGDPFEALLKYRP